MTKVITIHTHDVSDENAPWHDGSLAECPESTYTECTYEGKPARFYHGMSVTLPPNTTQRPRFIEKVEPIS